MDTCINLTLLNSANGLTQCIKWKPYKAHQSEGTKDKATCITHVFHTMWMIKIPNNQNVYLIVQKPLNF